MKKLLLTSAGFHNPEVSKEFLSLVNKDASEIKLVFVAADMDEDSAPWVKKSKQDLLDLGIKEVNILTTFLDRHIDYSDLRNFDAVFVNGGNTFLILDKFRKSNFDRAVIQFIDEGKVYVGVSAGSNITGPDIETCVTGIGDENTVGMKNTVGLNVVDFVTIPHYEHKDEEEIKKWEEKVNYKLVRLTDDQAILVRGDKTRIIE